MLEILAQALLYNYHYDQLNRIVAMDAYGGINASGGFAPIALDDYKERLSYGPNGNIKPYNRNGTGTNINLNQYSYNLLFQ